MELLQIFLKGLFIAILYFETTKANDTTFENLVNFSTLYTIMIYSAMILGVDANIVSNAFITKTIFTLVDERIRKTDEPKAN
jgi:hypothetical protein